MCLFLDTSGIQHTYELLIEYVLIAKGGKCRGKANILQKDVCTTNKEPLSHSCTQVKLKTLNVLILGNIRHPAHS